MFIFFYVVFLCFSDFVDPTSSSLFFLLICAFRILAQTSLTNAHALTNAYTHMHCKRAQRAALVLENVEVRSHRHSGLRIDHSGCKV